MHHWDREADVICVGGGLAGCAAALAADDHGFDALLLEKDARIGGKTAWSNGGIWIPENDLARAAGIADSRDEARAYLRFLAAGHEVAANLDAYVDNGAETLRYFARLGVPFQLVRNLPDIYYGMAPGTKVEGWMVEVQLVSALALGAWREKLHVSPYRQKRATFDEAVRWGGRGSDRQWDPNVEAARVAADERALGEGAIAAFVKALLDRAVPIVLDAPARELIVDDGRVTGLIARIDGRDQAIRARAGVVLASGGYESNPVLVRNYEELPFRNQFPATLSGDALTMAAEIGAMVRAIPQQLTIFLGYDVPAHDGKPASFRTAGTHELPFPHSIVVNRAGRRFGDESFFQKLLGELRRFDVATHTYRNLPCFFVFSRGFAERYAFGGAPAGVVPEFVARGETPEELAVALGIDPGGLGAEIARFNGFVAAGVDADFGRGEAMWSRYYSGDLTSATPNLGALEPPFYAVQLHPTGMSSAGLLTNERGQVVSHRDRPIPGLYASGDCAAYVDFGIGYQAGLSLGRNLIFSLAAVRDMRA